MILPDLILPSRVNQRWQYSGMDSPEHCLDKKYFWECPYEINYQYNSRGFRDAEWPECLQDLQQAVWCIGDSFTVGIGQPFDHIWPQVLSRRLQTRTINISMDGASNDWICRKAKMILDKIDPVLIIIMWSYTHRREHPDQSLTAEQRRIYSTNASKEQDFAHWQDLIRRLHDRITSLNKRSHLVQCTIPDYHHPIFDPVECWNAIKDAKWPKFPERLDDFDALPDYILRELKDLHGCYIDMKNYLEQELCFKDIIHIRKRLDWARDYHHFDILTAEWVVDRLLEKIPDRIVARNSPPAVSADRSDLR